MHITVVIRAVIFYFIYVKIVTYINTILTCFYIYRQFVVVSIFVNTGSKIIYSKLHVTYINYM